ncbi:MAG TPA: FCD domain-containing protein [Stellaceae bacterium]|jgi:DNA-binding GntR family transcriptional regulator|nr:FCD domain-containing protein [Stellaceae bacterium]
MKFSEPELAPPPEGGARTQSSALVERVRADIVVGALAPGTRLKLPDLAERYQSGINPLREALARLSATGLVVLEDQKGFRVAPVSRQDLLDLTRVRTDIECLALRQSIVHGDVEWEAQVIATHHRLTRMKLIAAGNPKRLSDAWETIHQDFHLALISACQSRWLIQFHNQLAEQSARYRRLAIDFTTSKRDIPGEHADIVKAVLDRDADRACRLISAHFARTSNIVLGGSASNRRQK